LIIHLLKPLTIAPFLYFSVSLISLGLSVETLHWTLIPLTTFITFHFIIINQNVHTTYKYDVVRLSYDMVWLSYGVVWLSNVVRLTYCDKITLSQKLGWLKSEVQTLQIILRLHFLAYRNFRRVRLLKSSRRLLEDLGREQVFQKN